MWEAIESLFFIGEFLHWLWCGSPNGKLSNIVARLLAVACGAAVALAIVFVFMGEWRGVGMLAVAALVLWLMMIAANKVL